MDLLGLESVALLRAFADELRPGGAALAPGFEARHCEERLRPMPFVDGDDVPPGAVRPVPPPAPPGIPPNIWALHPLAATPRTPPLGAAPSSGGFS